MEKQVLENVLKLFGDYHITGDFASNGVRTDLPKEVYPKLIKDCGGIVRERFGERFYKLM